MPPTMRVTVGSAAFPPEPEPELELEQAVSEPVRATAPMTAPVRVLLSMAKPFLVFVDGERGGTSTRGRGSDRGGLGRGGRAPGEQAALDAGEQELDDERDRGDDEHRGEHPVRVELVLRGGDDQAEALLR